MRYINVVEAKLQKEEMVISEKLLWSNSCFLATRKTRSLYITLIIFSPLNIMNFQSTADSSISP